MATLEQVFQREKAWIAECGDVDALMDKIQDWRDSARAAERDGNMLIRMRAGDLVELAQKRVVRLTASAIRAEATCTPPPKQAAPKLVERRAVETAREPEPKERQPAADPGGARRDAEAEAESAAAAKVKADARLATAEADRIELQNKLLRAQVEAAQRAAAAPVTARPTRAPAPASAKVAKAPPAANGAQVSAVPLKPATAPTTAAREPALPRPPTPEAKPAAVPFDDSDGYTEADRLALASVGHWPPTPRDHRGAFWSKHDDWPRDWTLTGGDLGRFRGEINLTRAVLAAQLGVPSAAIKDAELKPRERPGPALQIALRRAMAHEVQARRARKEARAAGQASPASAAAAMPSAPAPLVVARAASGPSRAFTGADLAGLRAERRLSQREMADLLGVEQGTISKGEGKGDTALGPTLQEALARLAAGGPAATPE